METVLQALGAMLAAVGLLALAWLCFGKLLLPVSGEGGGPVYAVLPAAGEGETLEHDVRALCWLRGSEAARFTIVIADGGLSEQGRAAALALMRQRGGMVLCPLERLGEYLAGGLNRTEAP